MHRVGSWAYGKGRGGGDNSNTRFAAIALAEAERRGVDVDPDVWKRLRDYLLDSQNEDGSWGYHPRQAGYGSMTCGAIASLAASSKKCTDEAEKSRCVAAIDAGWRWLEDCFTTRENPGAKPVWVHYYLESLARAATATKKTKIAGHDWRQEGTTTLLSWQDGETGMWKGDDIANRDPVIDTSFALLFLAESSLPDLNIFQGEMQTTGENRNSLYTGSQPLLPSQILPNAVTIWHRRRRSIDARDTSLAASSEKQATGVAVVGRVVRDGRPVSGFHVGLRRASPPQTGDKYYRFDLLDESITDRAGRYGSPVSGKTICIFLEVEMQDDAEVRGWDYQFGVSHTVRVEGQATIELPDAVLMVNNQTLSGVVVDSDGIPVEESWLMPAWRLAHGCRGHKMVLHRGR